MTIQEAVELLDRMEPNQYSIEDKIAWLDKLDRKVWREVILTHEIKDGEQTEFTGYTESTDPDTELLISAPDAEDVYLNWLKAEVQKANAEIGRYNASVTFFNDAFASYEAYHNRTHMPIQLRPFIGF